MRRKHHRILRIAIALLLAAALLCTPAAAARSGSCGQGLQWQLSGGVLHITGTGALPAYTDNSMPPWYGSAGSITTVIVGSGVTAIGDLAFYGCTALTAVRLPDSVTAIGAAAFKDCSALGSIALPPALLSIGEAAFENCEKLGSITLPAGLRSIGDFAFYRCTGLTLVVVPTSLQQLGKVSFAYCTSLVRAEVNGSLTDLPDWTFYGCTSLTEVSLPRTVTTTGESAFGNCRDLQTIYYDGTADIAPPQGSGTGASVSPTEEMPPSGSNSGWDFSGSTAESTTVTNTENSSLTEKNTTEMDIKINGKDSSLEEVSAAGEQDKITIETEKTTAISGTVKNPEGWNELVEKVDNALRDSNTVAVDVKLEGSAVSGEDLSKLAEKNVNTTITTASGSTWQLDKDSNTKKDFSQKEYDLDYSVSDAEGRDKPDIDSDKVYRVDFAGSTDFNATVGIRIPDAKRQYASLYQDKDLIQTTIVDDDGMAWFSLANVDAKTNYYIGVNARGVDPHQAVIPDSLSKTYGADGTLTDSSGKQYQVTGRASRWGITGSQFTTYVGIAIGLVVLIVALVMITINKLANNKAKYATPQGDDDAIDEEALRLQIMQEMLEETRQSNNKKQ